MKATITSLVFFALSAQVAAQSTFQMLYDLGPDNAVSISALDDGLLLGDALGNCLYPNGLSNICYPLIKVDLDGTQEWSRFYFDAGDILSINKTLSVSGGFASTGTYVGPNGYEPFICKFNEFGDTLWFKTYKDSLRNNSNLIIQSNDNGYVIYGQGKLTDSTTHMYMTKVDSLGNEEWTKVLDTGYPQNHGGSVHALPDGGYIVGLEGSLINNQDDELLLLRTDALGNTLWVRPYQVEDNDHCSTEALLLPNGGYALRYCKDTFSTVFNRPAKLYATDADGNLDWEYTFPLTFHGLYRTALTPDGDIIGCGMKMVLEEGHPLIYKRLGWMFRMSQEGELLWQRSYVPERPLDSLLDWGAQFHHLTATPDGGIAAVGIAPDTIGGAGGTDVWLVKVGPDGCFEPGCDDEIVFSPVSSAGEGVLVSEGKAQVRVWPNPATSGVMVSLPMPLHKGAVWSLHDQLGREVRRAVLSAGQQEVQVSVEDVPQGLYFWKMGSEGTQVGSGKLIISK
jgi:hypothetical protein